MARVGRLLQSCSNSWVYGFSLDMGIASNNIAELGAVCQGLILAWDLSFKFIHLEANGCMDALAKRGCQQQCLLEVYDTCPSFVYAPFV